MTDKKVNRTENRPKRKPLHRKRLLEAEKREGFVRRWVNEEIGAIEAYQEAGYTLVLDKNADASDKRAQEASQIGSVTRRVVNKNRDASAKTAVLMEIPEEYYKEDQAAKQLDLDELEVTFNPEEIKKRNPELYGSVTKKYS